MPACLQSEPVLRAILQETVLRNQFIPHDPTAKQAEFLLSDRREVLYGGAAGGGKSEALLMGALQYVDVPGYAALLLRRTYADLALPGALMDMADQWLRGTAATWNGTEKTWTFPSGATLTFGYLQTPSDKYRYQGAAFQFIGLDEATQMRLADYKYLFSRLRRLAGVIVPIRMRAASNPGGTGHAWVYERFIVDSQNVNREFIPALLADNPYLDAEEYTKTLMELDDITKAQLLDGLWITDPAGKPFNREWWARGDNRFLANDVAFQNRAVARYWSWDTANKTGAANAYTVGICGELTPDHRLAIRRVYRDRLAFTDLPNTIAAQARVVHGGAKLQNIIIEDRASGTPALQVLQQLADPMIAKKLIAFSPRGSKEERWQRAAVWCKRGCVLLPYPSMDAAWLSAFENELFEVPNTEYFDQADAFAQLIDYLSHILAAGWRGREAAKAS